MAASEEELRASSTPIPLLLPLLRCTHIQATYRGEWGIPQRQAHLLNLSTNQREKKFEKQICSHISKDIKQRWFWTTNLGASILIRDRVS